MVGGWETGRGTEPALGAPHGRAAVARPRSVAPALAAGDRAGSGSIPSVKTSGLPYRGTIHESLGIEVVEMSPDRVVLEMKVGPKVHQPFGLLHGGASAVIAESAASIGAYLNCDPDTEIAMGIELSVSHLRARRNGTVRATGRPVRRGRTIHVWAVDIVDEDDAPVAVARCTVVIRPRST